jgi:hypothetical protein
MELQFYKKTELTEGGDEIYTYYVLNNITSTFIIMNKAEPIRYVISCLPAPIEINDKMLPITQSEFLAAATKSNNAACWYVDAIDI